MADLPKTQFLTDNALTRKKWARELFRIILPAVEFNDLVGTGSESIVQSRTELGKGEGDEITFGIRKPLTGDPVVGNDNIEGNEEKLIFRNFKMTVEELNKAVDTGGKMEEQRVPYNLMQEGKDALQEWWSQFLSDFVINTLCGNTNFKVAGKTFAQACTNPDVYHHMAPGQADGTAVATAEAAVTANDIMSLDFLDRMKQRAEMPTGSAYKLRPLRMGGKSYFHVILHTFQFDALRKDTNIGQWGDLLRAANKLALPNVEIEYNGMLIRKSERVPKMLTVGTGGVYRAVMCGAQSACWAWGGAGDTKSTTMSFVPYTRDADRFLMIRGGAIFGMKKTQFDSMDFGCIVGSTYGERLT